MLTIGDMHELAASNGGKFLSKQYYGVLKKHKWQCAQGHTWEARVNQIRYQRKWCPHCIQEEFPEGTLPKASNRVFVGQSEEYFYSFVMNDEKKNRLCLKCGTAFLSKHYGNRCCGSCAAQNSRAGAMVVSKPIY